MDRESVLALLERTPVVAAVKDNEGLEHALACDAAVVFLLYGTVVDIAAIVARVRAAGKVAVVHLDLIDGLAARDISVDFIKNSTEADGIISTKLPLVRRAKELGLLSIHRFFLLDSMAMKNIRRQLPSEGADLIEILPGVMPKQLRIIAQSTAIPFIAGGLVNDKEDVLAALSAGAVAVSSTNPAVWAL